VQNTECTGDFVDYYYFLEEAICANSRRQSEGDTAKERYGGDDSGAESCCYGQRTLEELGADDRRGYETKLILSRLMVGCALGPLLGSATTIVKSEYVYSSSFVSC
jgi:hypothetical protein